MPRPIGALATAEIQNTKNHELLDVTKHRITLSNIHDLFDFIIDDAGALRTHKTSAVDRRSTSLIVDQSVQIVGQGKGRCGVPSAHAGRMP